MDFEKPMPEIGPIMGTDAESRREPERARQDPALLRRLLRAKDRMDAASHEAWPVPRLARVSGVSQAHFSAVVQTTPSACRRTAIC